MKFDRNTVVGFSLLALLFFFYFFYNTKQQKAAQAEQVRQDSIAKAMQPKLDTAKMRVDANKADSLLKTTKAGIFVQAAKGSETLLFAENSVFKIAFTNKGGQPKYVELKKYKNAETQKPVRLAESNFNSIGYNINTAANQSSHT